MNAFDWQNGVREILARHGVTLDTLRVRPGPRRLNDCRREIIEHLVNERGWSLSKTGIYLNRDHATIMHHLRRTSRFKEPTS